MNRTPKHKSGFTIIEVMTAMVILAILMTAVAVAFDASVKNYHANEGIYQTVNTGRQALLRITTDLRTAQAVALIGAGGDTDNTQVSLITAGGDDVTYKFDNTDNTLYYIDNDTSTSYTLSENVTAMTFNRATFIDVDDSSTEKVRNVRMSMTLTDDRGDISQTLAAASVIRRNL
ncbi:MAG: PulJ/GspJ family protein [Planctomycetota bacterium]|jgi:prepilin-type N-terminal cleavage/methylation domain-containing protein